METREKVNLYIKWTLLLLMCVYTCRWILALYDVDVFDYDTNQAVVDTAPLNEGVEILEFDYLRKEVEVV